MTFKDAFYLFLKLEGMRILLGSLLSLSILAIFIARVYYKERRK